ncbi:MAG: hypothetical protein AAB389_04140 [Patescibacteria group bacterium]
MRKQIFLIGLSVIAIIGGGTGIYFGIFNGYQEPEPIADNLPIASSTPVNTENPAGSQTVENKTPKYKGQALRAIGNDQAIKDFTPEVVAMKKAELQKFAALAEKDSSDTLAWLKISEIKKFFNNYQGSADALEYLKLLAPDDFIVNLNLGNLYGFYLKDYKKAEDNFQNAMNHSGGAQLATAISSLADMYKDFYKVKYDQVDNLLLLGIETMPDDTNLVIKLAFYYKEAGNKEGAIQSFERLLSMQGLTGAQQKAFEDEIAALKQS